MSIAPFAPCEISLPIKRKTTDEPACPLAESNLMLQPWGPLPLGVLPSPGSARAHSV